MLGMVISSTATPGRLCLPAGSWPLGSPPIDSLPLDSLTGTPGRLCLPAGSWPIGSWPLDSLTGTPGRLCLPIGSSPLDSLPLNSSSLDSLPMDSASIESLGVSAAASLGSASVGVPMMVKPLPWGAALGWALPAPVVSIWGVSLWGGSNSDAPPLAQRSSRLVTRPSASTM